MRGRFPPAEDVSRMNDAPILSHGHGAETLAGAIAAARQAITARGDLAYAGVGEQLDLLEQLAAFPFGRFLLQNRGWNGFWTDYVMQHPDRGRASGRDPDGRLLTPLERRLLDEFPTVLATQQRSRLFAAAIQARVRPDAVLASIPCGLMRDLLARDAGGAPGLRLVGIDLDDDSLILAGRLAEGYGRGTMVTLLRRDAWALEERESFDLIASNGLNIYEPDDDRVRALYRAFFDALRPGGVLVTSALTPPPTVDPASEWRMDRIDAEALRLQRVVFADIIGTTFHCYRSSATTLGQLRVAGFAAVEVQWDEARLFPTFVATRPAA
jgi:SAM-dependent methyltransferase